MLKVQFLSKKMYFFTTHPKLCQKFSFWLKKAAGMLLFSYKSILSQKWTFETVRPSWFNVGKDIVLSSNSSRHFPKKMWLSFSCLLSFYWCWDSFLVQKKYIYRKLVLIAKNVDLFLWSVQNTHQSKDLLLLSKNSKVIFKTNLEWRQIIRWKPIFFFQIDFCVTFYHCVKFLAQENSNLLNNSNFSVPTILMFFHQSKLGSSSNNLGRKRPNGFFTLWENLLWILDIHRRPP